MGAQIVSRAVEKHLYSVQIDANLPIGADMHKLYHFPLSPFSRKVRLVLAEKKIEQYEKAVDTGTEREKDAARKDLKLES